MFGKIFTLTFMLLFAACVEKASNPPISDGGGTTDNGGTTTEPGVVTPTATPSTSNSCDVIMQPGVGEGYGNYIQTHSIVSKGAAGGTVQWASNVDPNFQDTDSQNQFMTDSRFNIRVLAHKSPGKSTTYDGQSCDNYALPYTKLKMKVKVRSVEGAQREYTFENIPVDGCSVVHAYSPPPSSSPLIVEVSDIQWDYSCIYYANAGFPDEPSVCPWDYVWWSPTSSRADCVEYSLQIATDFTKDIPH